MSSIVVSYGQLSNEATLENVYLMVVHTQPRATPLMWWHSNWRCVLYMRQTGEETNTRWERKEEMGGELKWIGAHWLNCWLSKKKASKTHPHSVGGFSYWSLRSLCVIGHMLARKYKSYAQIRMACAKVHVIWIACVLSLQHTATHYNRVHRDSITATHCNTLHQSLQHAATHYTSHWNTLQHTTTEYIGISCIPEWAL